MASPAACEQVGPIQVRHSSWQKTTGSPAMPVGPGAEMCLPWHVGARSPIVPARELADDLDELFDRIQAVQGLHDTPHVHADVFVDQDVAKAG